MDQWSYVSICTVAAIIVLDQDLTCKPSREQSFVTFSHLWNHWQLCVHLILQPFHCNLMMSTFIYVTPSRIFIEKWGCNTDNRNIPIGLITQFLCFQMSELTSGNAKFLKHYSKLLKIWNISWFGYNCKNAFHEVRTCFTFFFGLVTVNLPWYFNLFSLELGHPWNCQWNNYTWYSSLIYID